MGIQYSASRSHLLDAEEQLVWVSLRHARLLLDVHVVIVELVVVMGGVIILVLLWRLRVWRGSVCRPGRCAWRPGCMVEIDHFIAVVEAVVRLGICSHLLLRRSDGARL
jgi:hypothetical protein